ncbi:hypothetical protein GCM10008995_11550 [Halobellus salinus]|uniref:Malate synthase H C-terminal domain-containing protein n=1 Tax=Halobellus salinus TaxID=931585 RepID=A0A830ELT7_9EURY|nr:hypothetical protein GCM10008995_11550 [Halobellus salinus]
MVAVDGPYDDIRDVEGYHERMTDTVGYSRVTYFDTPGCRKSSRSYSRQYENRAKGMTGIWSLTSGQVVEANKAPLPPKAGRWLVEAGGRDVELRAEDGKQVYEGSDLELEVTGDREYHFRVGDDEHVLDESELQEKLLDLTSYVPSLNDIVDSMEEFEAAKKAGRGAIAMSRSATLVIDGVEVEISADRMWGEATYQAAQTPITLFQDVYEHRPDQHEELAEIHGRDVIDRAVAVGN